MKNETDVGTFLKNNFMGNMMDTKTKLVSIIAFSYISMGLLILIPLGLSIFIVSTIPTTWSWIEIVSNSIFTLIGGTFWEAFMILFKPVSVLENFSRFIQTISVRSVGSLFIGLLNWVSAILLVWFLVKFKHDFKTNKDIQRLKIHFKILLGVYLSLLIVWIIIASLPLTSFN